MDTLHELDHLVVYAFAYYVDYSKAVLHPPPHPQHRLNFVLLRKRRANFCSHTPLPMPGRAPSGYRSQVSSFLPTITTATTTTVVTMEILPATHPPHYYPPHPQLGEKALIPSRPLLKTTKQTLNYHSKG